MPTELHDRIEAIKDAAARCSMGAYFTSCAFSLDMKNLFFQAYSDFQQNNIEAKVTFDVKNVSHNENRIAFLSSYWKSLRLRLRKLPF